jgi:hypothetical protein
MAPGLGHESALETDPVAVTGLLDDLPLVAAPRRAVAALDRYWPTGSSIVFLVAS